jgi:regulator of replication initiation timing
MCQVIIYDNQENLRAIDCSTYICELINENKEMTKSAERKNRRINAFRDQAEKSEAALAIMKQELEICRESGLLEHMQRLEAEQDRDKWAVQHSNVCESYENAYADNLCLEKKVSVYDSTLNDVMAQRDELKKELAVVVAHRDMLKEERSHIRRQNSELKATPTCYSPEEIIRMIETMAGRNQTNIMVRGLNA